MNGTATSETLERVALLHSVLDSRELAGICGALIEESAGAVPWRVRLNSHSDDENRAYLSGVGSIVECGGEIEEWDAADFERFELLFRGDGIGWLEVRIDHVPEPEPWSDLTAHLAVAIAKLRLWIDADDEARRRRLDQEIMGEINILVGSFDADYVLARSLEQVLKIVGSEIGSVMLWDGHKLSARFDLGFPEEVAAAIRLDGKPVSDVVFEARQPLLLSDPVLDKLPSRMPGLRLDHLLVIPLMSAGRSIGVLHAVNPGSMAPGSRSLESAEEICHLVAIAVENALLHKEAVQKERMATIGQVMAGLSHDIKNMLQVMRAGYELLRMGLESDDFECVRQSRPIVKSGVDRISDLVLDMLDYSKGRKPSRTATDINGLVAEIATDMSLVAEQKNANLSVNPDPLMEEVPIDATGLFRCLSNLVGNAIEAVGEDGNVVIRTSGCPGEPDVEIVVSDDGPGIPEENREHVFDALFTTKGSKGTGLGLAVTRKIIEEHGGTIQLGVGEDGRGAIFIVQLPKNPADSN